MPPSPPAPVEVFTNKEQLLDRLVVLTTEAVFTANPEKPQIAGVAAKVAGTPAVKAVVPDADEVAFKSISKVKTNRHRTDINIYHHDGSRERIKNIDFESAALRDRVFESLRRRLGPRFTKDEVQYGIVQAALAPLLTVLGFAAATWFLMGAAQELADGVDANVSGRNAAAKGIMVMLLDLLGPTGVLIVGGLCVIAGVAWLVARLKNPPLMATLTAKK